MVNTPVGYILMFPSKRSFILVISEPSRSESDSPVDHVNDPEIQRILDESHETGYLFEEELEDTKRVIKR